MVTGTQQMNKAEQMGIQRNIAVNSNQEDYILKGLPMVINELCTDFRSIDTAPASKRQPRFEV